MLTFNYGDPVPSPCSSAVLALGNFDGVHRGHRAILSCAKAIGVARERPVGVLLFAPHPRLFFQPEAPFFHLTPGEVKLNLLEACGLDFVVIVHFDTGFAALKAETFISEVLSRGLGISHVVVGSHFRFGQGREGSTSLLMSSADRFRMGASIVKPVMEGEEICSSSAVRRYLRMGDVVLASRILGYHWFVRGRVIHGDHRGQALGFPTANIVPPPDMALAHGVYAVRLRCGDRGIWRKGVANLGVRLTFGGRQLVLETHLFDFSDDLYGSLVDVAFSARIRPEVRFVDASLLIDQVRQDCLVARRILANSPLSSLLP